MNENILHLSIIKGLPWEKFKEISKEYPTDTVYCLHANKSRSYRIKYFCVSPIADLEVWKGDDDKFTHLLHNPYGPAMVFKDRDEYYLNGRRVSFSYWLTKASISDKHKTALKLKYYQ